MGDLFADIIEDRRTDPPIIFCVVQRQSSPEILFLGQYRSRSEAAHSGQQVMSEYLNQRASSTAGQGIA